MEEISRAGNMSKSSMMLAMVSNGKVIRRIPENPKLLLPWMQGVDLYAYEVLATQEECKRQFPVNIVKPKFEPGEYVDVYDVDTRDWRIGKIQHNFSEKKDEVSIAIEGANKKITALVSSPTLDAFMSHTVNYNEISVFPLYHRYRSIDGRMVYFGMPKLLSIGTWATCGKVVEEVLVQVKHFVALDTALDQSKILYSSKTAARNSKTRVLSKSQTNLDLFDLSSLKVSLIDKTNDTCAICSSRMISGNKFLYSTITQKCTGCNLLKYKDISVKYLAHYFGNVALCVDWANRTDYKEPEAVRDMGRQDYREMKYEPKLEDCLRLFTAKEKISDYACDKCKKKGTSEVQTLISELPDILILHLKRFLFMDTYVEKLTAKVTFPLQRLNMTPWISKAAALGKGSSVDYDLYAVANHHSTTASGGHYTALVKSEQVQGAWVTCDDSMRTNVTAEKVVTENAYLLFYKKRVMSTSNIVNLTYKAFT